METIISGMFLHPSFCMKPFRFLCISDRDCTSQLDWPLLTCWVATWGLWLLDWSASLTTKKFSALMILSVLIRAPWESGNNCVSNSHWVEDWLIADKMADPKCSTRIIGKREFMFLTPVSARNFTPLRIPQSPLYRWGKWDLESLACQGQIATLQT